MAENPDTVWGDSPDLDEFLQGEEPPWELEPLPPHSAQRADQLLRRLGSARGARARDQARFEELVAQASLWLEGRQAIHDRQISWLEASLEAYAAGVFARTGLATIRLPSGDLPSRKKPDEWTIDPEKFLPWAQEHLPLAVRQKPLPAPEVDVAAAKKLIGPMAEKTGELPPGVSVKISKPSDRTYRAEPRTQEYPE